MAAHFNHLVLPGRLGFPVISVLRQEFFETIDVHPAEAKNLLEVIDIDGNGKVGESGRQAAFRGASKRLRHRRLFCSGWFAEK